MKTYIEIVSRKIKKKKEENKTSANSGKEDHVDHVETKIQSSIYLGIQDKSALHQLLLKDQVTSTSQSIDEQPTCILKNSDVSKDMSIFTPLQKTGKKVDPDTVSWTKLRYFIHNCNSYQVLATCQKIRLTSLNHYEISHWLRSWFLSHFSLDDCHEFVSVTNLLLTFYRFPRIGYPMPSFCCSLCEQGSCSCIPLPKDFYIYCSSPCPSHYGCNTCAHWGTNYHTCFDFYFCDVCSFRASYKDK
jgi:hypothetical protein